MSSNLRLYPWFKFVQSLTFWQAVWFLFFQNRLSAAEAILIYAIFDISTTVLEVPSGWLSDKVGRRITLIFAAVCLVITSVMQAVGDSFWVYALAQIPLGAAMAFASGTDSSLLYESLSREGRENEIEAHEIRAWRFSFTALALSAVAGGVMTGIDDRLPYVATAVSGGVMVWIAFGFREPPHAEDRQTGVAAGSLGALLVHPVLAWCFVLSLCMYVFSHVPFVFGQPFILEALETRGLSPDAPLVSGVITALMMLVSVATSWLAPGLRARVGLGGILLIALAMQVALIAALAASNHILVISLLLLRMVPNAWARPFLLARIQPLLSDGRRATYLSLQSFAGRLLFAASLIFLSFDTSGDAPMVYAEIRAILLWYLGAGVAALGGLALTVRVLEARKDE